MSRLAGISALILVLFMIGAQTGRAGEKDPNDVVDKARIVLKEIMRAPDAAIPDKMLSQCAGLAIVPDVVKAGFIVGGKYGEGVILTRNSAGGWNGPAFIKIAGGSLGWQIGIQSIDLVLVIMKQSGVKELIESQVELGADVSVAAGPVGRQAGVGGDVTFKSAVYSYSRAKGLFAGVSLEGMGVDPNDDLSERYYGQLLTAEEILFQGQGIRPETGNKLVETIERYAK